jgi:hypothetical protein
MDNGQNDFMRPLAAAWVNKVRLGQQHKQPFDDVGKQCMSFFSGAVGFMWQPEYLKQFVGGSLAPRFKITVAKAFELVALYGPSMYWQNPTRLVKPRKRVGLSEQLFMGIQDPMAQQIYMQAMQQRDYRKAADLARSELEELYLNYTPGVQPDGGLAAHSSSATTESLVKGRGCLWVKPYVVPGSGRVLTGAFYDSCDNLISDPDAPGPKFHGAKWVAQKVCQPYWQAEKEFQLPKDSLKRYANMESADRQGETMADEGAKMDRQVGKTFDLITYYKVWSKGGIGARLSGQVRMQDELGEALDRVVGDYAYIVVAPGVPFPLNAHPEKVRSSNDTEIERLFRWPVPYWMQDRWPVALLEYYEKPGSSYPIAPMAPGLGELTYINVLLSQLANRTWMTSRCFPLVPRKMGSEVEAAMNQGKDLTVLRYDEHQKGEAPVSFVTYPEVNQDSYRLLEIMSENFDRRTGLTELLYGLNPGGTQSRTAEDAAGKRQMVSIRPDYMAGKVEDWQSEVADMELFCSRFFVDAQQLGGMLDPAEQFLWQHLIDSQDPSSIIEDLRATVAANSTRKPDKVRDVSNMNQLVAQLMPVLQEYSFATGDFNPLNAMIAKIGDTLDEDLDGLMMQPPPPPESTIDPAAEAQMLQQQQLAEAHQQKLEMQGQAHQQKMAQGQQSMALTALTVGQKMKLAEEQAKQRKQQAAQQARKKKKAA